MCVFFRGDSTCAKFQHPTLPSLRKPLDDPYNQRECNEWSDPYKRTVKAYFTHEYEDTGKVYDGDDKAFIDEWAKYAVKGSWPSLFY